MQQSTGRLETVMMHSGEQQKEKPYTFGRNTDLIGGGAG